MLTTKTARWTALTALLCVGLLTLAWFALVGPRRAEAAEIREQTEAARAQNDALELRITQLKAQFADLPRNKADLAKIYAQMPAKAAMPDLVRSLDSAAASSGVTIQSVTPSAAVLLTSPTPAASGAAASAAPAAPAASAAPAAPAAPATGSAGPAGGGLRVVAIPLTIVAKGDYFQTVTFLKKVQTELPRAFVVNTLQIANDAAAGSAAGGATSSAITMTIGGKVFALPDAAAQTTTGTAASQASQAGASTPQTGASTS
jgi:Tfp pilus assembly protein PilO